MNYIAIFGLVMALQGLVVYLWMEAKANQKRDEPERRTADPSGFVDYSRFDQDQLLRNRSERWD